MAPLKVLGSSKRQPERVPGKGAVLGAPGTQLIAKLGAPVAREEERPSEHSRRCRYAAAPATPLRDARASAQSACTLGCAQTCTHSWSQGKDLSSVSQGQRPRPRGFLSPLTQCKDLHPIPFLSTRR